MDSFEIVKKIKAHEPPISGSPNGSVNYVSIEMHNHFFSTASDDQTVKFWALEGYEDKQAGELISTLSKQESIVSINALSKEGNLLATANWAGFIRIYKTNDYWKSYQEVFSKRVFSDDNRISKLYFKEENNICYLIFQFRNEKTIKAFRFNNGWENFEKLETVDAALITPPESKKQEIEAVKKEHSTLICSIFSADKKYLISGGHDGNLVIWKNNEITTNYKKIENARLKQLEFKPISMRLSKFQIKNVKSIIDSGVCYLSESDNITIMAGQNEAGKSAVLEALNFFSNGANDKFIKLSKRLGCEPYVECEFTIEQVDNDDSDIFQQIKKVSFYRDSTLADSKIKIKDHSLGKIAGKLQDKYTYSEGFDDRAAFASLLNSVIEDLISKLPKFVYYDSFNNLLPGSILISEILENQAVLDFQKVFDVNFSTLSAMSPQERTSTINKVRCAAEVDLNYYWKQTFTTSEDDKYQFNINYIPPHIEFLIHRNDNPLFLEQKSKGFQWFNAFNLRLKALGVEKNKLSNYILLIDEPGQGLHEIAQKDVKRVIEDLAEHGLQIIYTTHHPLLIDVETQKILRLRLVFQSKERGTKINNITQFASNKEAQFKDTISPVITAMGICGYNQVLDRDKKYVALEGITDKYYFSAFKQLLEIPEEYFFIPACGVDNIKPLISILISWGCEFKAVFDDGQGKTVYNSIKRYLYKDDDDLFSKTIKKLDKFNGIEDLFDSSDFDKCVTKQSREGKISNSDIAKQIGKKELLARLFLENVTSKKIKKSDLEKNTLDNFKNVFNWLKN